MESPNSVHRYLLLPSPFGELERIVGHLLPACLVHDSVRPPLEHLQLYDRLARTLLVRLKLLLHDTARDDVVIRAGDEEQRGARLGQLKGSADYIHINHHET